jgi:hypothetical protein
LTACVQEAPPELVQAVEELYRQMGEVRSAELAPGEYARFVQHWVALKERIRHDDVIVWPWEENPFTADLRALHNEGLSVLSLTRERQQVERHRAASRIAYAERGLRRLLTAADGLGWRTALGRERVMAELLLKQARSFLEQGRFVQAQQAAQQAYEQVVIQAGRLRAELGRYADPDRVSHWRAVVRQAVGWSQEHQATALVVIKAVQQLTVYQNGRAVASYPVRLGFNGMRDKRYQGDGATPEGLYRVIQVKDRGQTAFYRAFLLDYPNAHDRWQFHQARRAGLIPRGARLGGNVEIHGEPTYPLSRTLGCIMLSNRHMDALFSAVKVGTPVAIVGAVDVDNPVAAMLAQVVPDSGSHHEELRASGHRVAG